MDRPQPAALLVDCDLRMRQLRRTIFRNCEIDVRLAASLSYALTLCRGQRYDLVLVSGYPWDEVSRFCQELWKAMPKQRVALLVGPPTYLSAMKAKHAFASRESAKKIQLVETREPSSEWDHRPGSYLAVG